MSTFENVTEWRQLSDRLTADQIAQFDRYEANHPDPAEAAWMVMEARELVERNAAEAELFGHLPTPAGAVRVLTADRDGNGNWTREFEGVVQRVAGVALAIDGRQHPDGRITRQLTITVEDSPGADGHTLNADQARVLAVTLLELATELKSLR